MKLLVTGGAGFIGSNFIHYWLKNHPQDQVVNFDALTYAGNLENLEDIANNQNYTFVKGDIRNAKQVDQVMPGTDIIVHFAAETHVDRSILEPASFVTTNVVGTQILLDAALRHQIDHFHHIGTDEVFGSLDLDTTDKFTEQTPYNPSSPYSASKAASDHLVRAYGDTFGLSFTITNCSNNYGPYMFPEKFFPLAITNLIEGKNIPLYGDGLNVRDWLFVTDHCRAIELVLEKGKPGETYLVGGLNKDISNLEALQTMLDLMELPYDKITYIQDRPGHDRRYSVDWSKINRELGWEPAVTFEQGLRQTIDWYQHNQQWWKPLKEKNAAYYQKNYQQKA